MINKNDIVAILMGGPSSEAEISRNTGKAISEALASIGYHVVSVEYDPAHVLEQLKKIQAKVVFIAVHGKYGEDGTIQSVLELAQIPYTGSGVTSSAITMDKIMSSRVFIQAGIRMANSTPYYLKDGIHEVAKNIQAKYEFPIVIKPACEGSTIGVEIIKTAQELEGALKRTFSIEPRILAETYLDGEEFTVAVINGKALPVIQICPHSGEYDFHSKYTKGATDYLVPAPIPSDLAKEMSDLAILGYQVAECCGVVRFDFRTNKDGVPFLLEANSIPGMTATSLVPKAAAAVGIDFPQLCEIILQDARIKKV